MRTLLASAAALVLLVGCQAPAPEAPAALTPSYAAGLSVGAGLVKSRMTFDWDQFRKGVEAGFNGDQTYTEAQVQEALKTAIDEARQRWVEANAAKERAFLEDHARKEGVMVTPSGLQYTIVQPGSGSHPGRGDQVVVRYKTTRMDGSVIEDTTTREKPSVASVDKMLPGMAEAVGLLAPGGQGTFVIPSALAYGVTGRGDLVDPASPMVVTLDLIAFGPAPAKAP